MKNKKILMKLEESEKDKLKKAAAIISLNTCAFIRSSAIREADKIIKQNSEVQQ